MQKLHNYFLYSNWHAIEIALAGLLPQDRKLELITLACQLESIAVYTAACFFILKSEDAEAHHTASMIISGALVDFKGAYSSGLFHARKMIELNSDDYLNFEWGIFFYRIPENLVTRNEAYEYAQKIISMNAQHKLALDTKSEIESAWLHGAPEPKQYIPHDEEYPEFIKLVHTGFYEEAKNVLKDYTIDQIAALLHILMDRHQSVALYTYAFFMLLDQETAQGHVLVGRLLLQLKNVCGAQSGALFHARRAVELEPHSLLTLEFLLVFYALSEPLLTDDEACVYAQQLLAIDPEHAMALKVVQKM